MKINAINRALMCGVAAFLSVQVLAGPEWVEPNGTDAGNLPGSAAIVTNTATTTVTRIKGTLHPEVLATGAQTDFEDMFVIQIDDPIKFYASTSPDLGGSAEFDTQLWLFKLDGNGLLGNDNTWSQGGGDGKGTPTQYSTMWNFSTDGTEIVITEPGLYLLAISTAVTKPVSPGGEIFDFQFFAEVSGPDGPGGEQAISAWEFIDKGRKGGQLGPEPVDYTIALAGVVPVEIDVLTLGLDIDPRKCPNNFNTNNNGHTKVALLGSATFDVHALDLSSIRLSRVDGVGATVAQDNPPPDQYKDVSRPYTGNEPCGCQTLGADGFIDLQVKFKGWETTQALQLAGLPVGTIVPLKVTGTLKDATPFEAIDCVRISH